MANLLTDTLSEYINFSQMICPMETKQSQHTSLVLKFYFFHFLQKARKYTLSSRNNKYTIFLYEQNAQFTNVETENSNSYTLLCDCIHLTHL